METLDKIKEAEFHVEFVKSKLDKAIELAGEGTILSKMLKEIKELL